jgi:NhaP-type Na+/H+ or K+/H+ antiporter
VEAESLVNDGTAIVMFNVVLGIALAGQFNPITSVYSFV